MEEDAKTVCIVTFGCQMNKLDSQLLRGELERQGFGLTDEPDAADVVLYNTCSVRDHAENRVLSHLGAYRERAREQPGFVLGVIGCMAQRAGEELLKKFGYLDLVCGTRAADRVPGHIRHVLAGGGPILDLDGEGLPQIQRQRRLRENPFQAYVSIMRGCDNFCAYCIVPHVRGREVSRHAGDILREVDELVQDGVREVTLLGQNVNSYRDGERDLAALLAMLNEVDRLRRIRFVTSHPKDMSDAVLEAVAGLQKVCEHLHVPPQSGSDAVLERMRRGYTRADYLRMAERARNMIPDVQLAGDFIVGFPGETDADFEDTLDLLRQVRFQQAYLFKYSPRPGTLAARWEDDVPEEVKRRRHQRLLSVQEAVDEQRRRAMVGSEVEVLVEGVSPQDPENYIGRTRGNDIVVCPGDERLKGQVRSMEIVGATTRTLFGEPVGPAW